MSFTVDDFHDLVRLLEERPDWQADIRRIVLTKDLLALPEQVAELRVTTERRFQELAEAQARTEQKVTALAEAQARTEQKVTDLAVAQTRTEAQLTELTMEVRELTRTVRTLTDEVGTLKGINLEAEYRTKGHAYFSRVVRRPHVLSSDEIVSLVEDAQESGVFSDAEARELYEADVIVRGKRPEDRVDVYLLVEVSWGVGTYDVERAIKRSVLLARLGTAVIPVVAGKRLAGDAIQMARTHQVWQVTDGYALPPEAESGAS